MQVELIEEDCPCYYCKNQYDYKNTGNSCDLWYKNKFCNGEDFKGLPLYEVNT